ncbi:deoxyuridine 5'-triphosphate nucleotidohydrolase Dut [Ammonifex degensii KC4]|uniref:Deoxyuridine 5'-triphosphate nucleotidohydrolase n=1 Tax=Ammonifex degensii (strain DSM 10501 / KC4) TaxID=429009 RepID=C9R8W6_AMMDK|nr:dUTP diphosphatase [Ammonifex degensii]ACX52745.1 deoxyuridine 5'-triphosphate nucleotidohydrolase Dut [Ammonifex degensii KC4]
MQEVIIPIRRLPHAADLPLPAYATPFSAGLDLYAACAASITLLPGKWELIPTGISLALPEGYLAEVRPRSGLALQHGVTLLNSPGTIDADYRGEIKVILINLGDKPWTCHRGDRIAQLVVLPVARVVWREVEELDSTVRGEGGFGHTGR